MVKEAIKHIRFGFGKYECITCGSSIRRFFKFSDSIEGNAKKNGFAYDFRRMETLNYDQSNCPFCLSSDRERLYLLFIEKFILKGGSYKIKMLDFAPNKHFTDYLKKKNVDYFSADLFRTDVDFQVDICNMPSMQTATYDFVICSHILEHVESPERALSEIKRILKPGGKALLMVPLFWDVKETYEDKSHVSEEERCRYYGQDDHVRLFSKRDFTERIVKAGFVLNEYTVNDFSKEDIDRNAISSNSILYVGTNPLN